MKFPVQPQAILGFLSTAALVTAWPAGPAYAQEGHPGAHPAQESLSLQELVAGIVHGTVQGAVVFLVGLVVFAALVWLPASRSSETHGDAGRLFVRAAWVLFGVLVVAGGVELSVYAVRASGESFGPGLLAQALVETRVGNIWLARLGFGFLTALLASWAFREGALSLWITAGVGSALLITLTQQSHAAAEERLLPLVSDWLHIMAASVWMGGLLGFPLLLIGPLRALPAETRAKLLGRTVRRFSKVATIAVTILVVTGSYAALLQMPDLSALTGSPYGRALIMKLGMVALMLPIGAINLIDRGGDPFSRMVAAELLLALGVFVATGFLTTLPPPEAGSP